MDGNKVFVTLPCRIYTYHSRDCTWELVLWHWFSLASKMATSLNFAWLIWGGGGSLNNFRSIICTCVGCFYQEQRQRFPFQAVFGAFYQEEQILWCPFQCQYHHILQVVGTREVCRELLQPVQVYEVPRLYSLLLVKSLIPWTHEYYLNLQTLLPLCVTGTLLV